MIDPSNFPAFIAVEGIDGSGKTTFASGLREALRGEGISCIDPCPNPGTTPVGNVLRDILLNEGRNPEYDNLGQHTELCLFLAGNAQLLHEVVSPALGRGESVVMDRWNWSTLVYQVWLSLGDPSLISAVDRMAPLNPSVCFYLKVTPMTAYSRLKAAGKGGDRYEDRGYDFLEKLFAAYEQSRWVAQNWYPVVELNAGTFTPEELIGQALKHLGK